MDLSASVLQRMTPDLVTNPLGFLSGRAFLQMRKTDLERRLSDLPKTAQLLKEAILHQLHCKGSLCLRSWVEGFQLGYTGGASAQHQAGSLRREG